MTVMASDVKYPLTVFYDASCPVCAAQIEPLRNRDTRGRFELVDCSAPGFRDELLAADGLTRSMLMKRIRARDARGRWLLGIGALEAAYRALW